ncbi:hypothetical protein EOL70_15875 [Leucothrix sargassi]|nr:hypothetical protein EOL70_15875 [Leucothrix sargassi]
MLSSILPPLKSLSKNSAILLLLMAGNASASELAHLASGYTAKLTANAPVTSIKPGRLGAFATLGCNAQDGAYKADTVKNVGGTSLLDSNTANVVVSATDKQSISTSMIEDISLLGGLISADALSITSTTTQEDYGFTTDAQGAFTNLRIAGINIQDQPAANTKITIPGIGHVVINEQNSLIRANIARMTANMIHVYVDKVNLLGIKPGTELIVGSAYSGLRKQNGALGGFAQTVFLNAKARLNIPLTTRELNASTRASLNRINLGCNGTNGKLREKHLTDIHLPTIIDTATAKTTAQGRVTKTASAGEMTSSVEGVNIAGLITADLVHASADLDHGTENTVFTASKSEFVNLNVVGVELDSEISPNTRIKLDGIGVLWLKRVIQREKSLEVRMIDLIVTAKENTLGLSAGTRVIVGRANITKR